MRGQEGLPVEGCHSHGTLRSEGVYGLWRKSVSQGGCIEYHRWGFNSQKCVSVLEARDQNRGSGGCSPGTCLGLCLGPPPPSGLSSQAPSSLLAYHVYKDTFPKGTASGPRDQYRDMSLGATPGPTRSTLRRSILYPIQDSGGDEARGQKAAWGTTQSPPGIPDPGVSPHSCPVQWGTTCLVASGDEAW